MDRNEETSSTSSIKKSPEKRIESMMEKNIIKTSTICTVNCTYIVISKIAKIFNMKEVGKQDDWDVCWTDNYFSFARAKQMKSFQRVNHFPGMYAICRKDLLARNLNRMLKLFPKDYNFYPKTWCLTAEMENVLSYSRLHPNTTYIFKPDVGCRGVGIFLTKNLNELKFFEKMVCQVYIPKPFIMDGLKFDFRIYVLITSCDPLRIYVYNEGLARFATSPYREPAADNSTNAYMHLTNYSVNKDSEKFVVDEKAGNKRRITTINDWFYKNNYDVPKLWAEIDDMIVKTLISAYPTLKRSYRTCFSGHKSTNACFELLGFDVLLDNKLKPYLLEVNHSPSFNTEAKLDRQVKESLLKDTFRILNLPECKKRVTEEDKQRAQNRQMQDTQKKKGSPMMNERTRLPSEKQNIQIQWEETHLGNYRQVYPSTVAEKYSPFFNQTQSLNFKDTLTSRARGAAGKLQREEFELKMREDSAGMPSQKTKLITTKSTALQKPKLKNILMKEKPPCNSSNPTPKVETLEQEGLPGPVQKESLSRSGVIDQTNSGENTKGTMLEPPLPISECQPEENATGPILKPPLPINRTTEATVRLRPGAPPVSTVRPTTLGRKTTKNTYAPHLPNTARLHGNERRLFGNTKPAWR